MRTRDQSCTVYTEACACSEPVGSFENSFQPIVYSKLQHGVKHWLHCLWETNSLRITLNHGSVSKVYIFWAVFSSSPGATLSSCIHEQSLSVKIIVICIFKFFIKRFSGSFTKIFHGSLLLQMTWWENQEILVAPFLMSSSYFKRKEKYIKQFLSYLCLKQVLYITLNELIK